MQEVQNYKLKIAYIFMQFGFNFLPKPSKKPNQNLETKNMH